MKIMSSSMGVAGALMAAIAADASAQTDKPAPQVEIKASAQSARPAEAANKTIVSREELSKFGDTSVLDSLARVPGVTVSNGSLRMQGLAGAYTLVLVNGERVPPGFSLDSLSPDQIERIEIQRSASADISTQAVAGSINIILRKTFPVGSREIMPSLNVSESGATFRAPLSASVTKDGNGYSISLNPSYWRFHSIERQADDVRSADGQSLFHSDLVQKGAGWFKGISGTLRGSWTLAPDNNLTLQVFFNSGRYYLGYVLDRFTVPAAAEAYPQIVATVSNSNDYVRPDLTWTVKDSMGGRLEAKIALNAGQFNSDFYDHSVINLASPAYSHVSRQFRDDWTVSTIGKYSLPATGDHQWSTGWDLARVGRDDDRINLNFLPIRPRQDTLAQITRRAWYVQDEWKIAPSWLAYAGLRYESIRTNVDEETGRTANDFAVWSPIVQLLYKTAGDRELVRMALTRTFKAPDLAQLTPSTYYSTVNTAAEPDTRGNAVLKPELANGLDTSFEHKFDSKSSVLASLSLRRLHNSIRDIIRLEGDRWVQLPVNLGDASARSLQIEGKFPLWADGNGRAALARNWSSVSDVPGPRNFLAKQNPFSATLGADFKVARYSYGASYVLKTAGLVRDTDAITEYHSVERNLDLYTQFRIDSSKQLRIAAANLLHQSVDDRVSVLQADGSTSTHTNIRTGVASLRAVLEIKL